MPNWCQNSVLVSGNLTAFREWLGEDVKLTLSKIAPTPKELIERQAPFNGTEEESIAFVVKYGYDNWYDWNVHNWGTKWDIEAEFDEVSSDENTMFFSFHSAWSPPTIAMQKLSEMFSICVQIAYIEEGNGFVGCTVFENGEVLENEQSDDPSEKKWQNVARKHFGWEPQEDEENA